MISKERKKKINIIIELEKELWIPMSRYTINELNSMTNSYINRLLNMLTYLKGEGN